MRKSLRKTGILLAVLLLPALGWAASVPESHGQNAGLVERVSAFADGNDIESQDQDDKRRKKKDDPKQDDRKQDDRKKDDRSDTKRPEKDDRVKADGKPDIKEVPRSIPKLKPKTVTDRVRIKRPPVKIKPKGSFRVI
jgi:hypothetical protein